jgi:hypothetical protein
MSQIWLPSDLNTSGLSIAVSPETLASLASIPTASTTSTRVCSPNHAPAPPPRPDARFCRVLWFAGLAVKVGPSR